jgi:hypothetical protein
MATVVRETNTGIVAADFHPETLATALNRMTVEDVTRFKSAADAAAKEYSAEANRDNWLAVCRKVVAS